MSGRPRQFCVMWFYLFQWQYKDPAIKAMMETPQDRPAELGKAVEAFHGRVHQFFFAFGEYDVRTVSALIGCPISVRVTASFPCFDTRSRAHRIAQGRSATALECRNQPGYVLANLRDARPQRSEHAPSAAVLRRYHPRRD